MLHCWKALAKVVIISTGTAIPRVLEIPSAMADVEQSQCVMSRWFEMIVMAAIIVNTIALILEHFSFESFVDNWYGTP